MTEEKPIEGQPPVVTTIVTKREETVPHSTPPLETPTSIPSDIRVVAMSAARIVLVRTARVFFQSFLAALTVGGAGVQIFEPGTSHVLQSALIFAASTAAITALQNTVELLSKFDESHPQLRA